MYHSGLLRLFTVFIGISAFLGFISGTANAQPQDGQQEEDIILDNVPSGVIASMEVRDRWFAGTMAAAQPESYLVEDLLRWLPGQTVRVAFLGGDSTLHRDIEDATKQLTELANVKLDFGYNSATGKYRSWSTKDTVYKADIRVSFDQGGYFSLVGTDSISSIIGAPGDPVGGRPNQRTLNLQGFNLQRPADWRGVVRHEFLHALAFHHEHQSPSGGCDNEFRWQDDPGYQPTQGSNGRYVSDANGNRPGIYTYLAGYPNFWEKSKVDHNMRQLSPEGLSFDGVDQESVMLYRFPALFYRTVPSSCAPKGDGQNLSKGDKSGLLYLYPREAQAAEALTLRRQGAFDALLKSKSINVLLKNKVQDQFDMLKDVR